MGEQQKQPFQISFNSCLKVDFQGSRVTSDGGLLLVRELDDRLGLSTLIGENIRDERRGKNTFAFRFVATIHLQSLAGYEVVNHAERLALMADEIELLCRRWLCAGAESSKIGTEETGS